jgi:hypothetical protein
VPTIAELLLSYRDRTGHSYSEMAKRVRDELQAARLQQLVTAPPKAFPSRRTVELLAELLEVPTATIVLAFAAGLGIPVSQSGSMLERTLPPGTDVLTPEDREAIRLVTRTLVEARNAVVHGMPGSGKTQAAAAGVMAQAELEKAERRVEEMLDAGRPAINSPEPAEVIDYSLAARRGNSEGKRLRQQQDDDADT